MGTINEQILSSSKSSVSYIPGFETWHMIDGKWRHLVQIREGACQKFYTDGILVHETS